ncbi:MAG: hypothetical protein KDC58_06275 [Cyclobacteriaceae bacterium]|nr:hypothetical protein [Cyclobacteriaceae bacterium]
MTGKKSHIQKYEVLPEKMSIIERGRFLKRIIEKMPIQVKHIILAKWE